MRLGFLTVVLSFVLVFSMKPVRADESTTAPERPSRGAVQVGVTPAFGFSPNFFCERDSDMVSCHRLMFAVRSQIDIQYRLPMNWFAVGLVGGVDVAPYEAVLWRAAVEARFYPVIGRRAELWLAVEGGVVGAGGDAVNDIGGEAGGGFGVDFPLGRHFFIGLDIRALFFGFGAEDLHYPDGGNVEINNSAWFSIGLIKLGARIPL